MSVETELAVHSTEIKHIQDDMDRMMKDIEDIKHTLAEISRTLSEARGGWRTLMWAGGAVSAITAFIGFWVGHWGK